LVGLDVWVKKKNTRCQTGEGGGRYKGDANKEISTVITPVRGEGWSSGGNEKRREKPTSQAKRFTPYG